MGWWGFASGVNGSAAPFLAESFGLDDAAIAGWLAWIGLASLGTLALGRQVDRVGRRRVLLGCAAALPLAAAASALAPSPRLYVGAQLGAFAVGGTLLATVVVVIAEERPEGERARGQGRAGVAFAGATALPLLLVTALADRPDAWRWTWAACALPALALPWLRRRLLETRRFRDARARGETRGGRMTDIFAPRYRARALGVLAAVVLVQGVEFATRTWLFYHPVRALGLEPAAVTPVLIAGGGLGLLGFRLGGHFADRLGRRTTFLAASLLFGLSSVGYYWLPLHVAEGRLPLLGVSLLGLATGGNAAMTAFRSLATELFPTRLRGTLGGWMAVGSALGWWLAMSGASRLAGPLGGLGPAVACLVLVALPAAAALLGRLPETAGLALETAALEGECAPR